MAPSAQGRLFGARKVKVVLERNIGLIECYLDSMVKAALLGKIKDAACIDTGEQLFQCSTAKIFIANDCSTWTF